MIPKPIHQEASGLMTSERTCELDGTILRRKKVPVSYGLPVPDSDEMEARTKLFPDSKSYVLGGCCAGSIGWEYEDWVCMNAVRPNPSGEEKQTGERNHGNIGLRNRIETISISRFRLPQTLQAHHQAFSARLSVGKIHYIEAI